MNFPRAVIGSSCEGKHEERRDAQDTDGCGTGCGGAGSGAGSALAATTHTTATKAAISVAASNFKFKLSKTSVAKGTTVTFTVKNTTLTHNFKIDGKVTPMIKGGKSAKLVVTFAKAGKFPYLCTVPGHAAAGMKGTSPSSRSRSAAGAPDRPAACAIE